MANIAIPNLPPVVALAGPEQIEVVQSGSSARATMAQILAYIQTNLGITMVSSTPSILGPTVISNGSSSGFASVISSLSYGSIRIQIDNLSGGDSVSFNASLLSSETGPSVPAFDDNGGEYQSGVTVGGLYNVKGHAYVTVTKTGTASTPTVTYVAF